MSFDTLEQLAGSRSHVNLEAFWRKVQMPPGVFNDSYALWKASSTFEDLDGDSTDERILRLRDSDDFCRFIVLKRIGMEWRAAGHADVLFSHEPQARVISNERGRWLAINHIETGWGTGTFQENETWYALTDFGLTEYLSFPMEAH